VRLLLFEEFKAAFGESDHVIVSEIYASREKQEDYSSKEVVLSMEHPDARQIAELDDISDFLIRNLKSGDILLVLSAGDADRISQTVFKNLKEKTKSSI